MLAGLRSEAGPYRGCRVAMGTRHGKEKQIAPVFDVVLGARVVVPTDLDTDQFGTFTGERPRTLPALDAARAKAALAMRRACTRHGLASEATYSTLGGAEIVVHEEILLFTDDAHGIEIVETLRTPGVPGRRHSVRSAAQLPSSLLDGRPPQGWIVRPAGGDDVAAISKGLTSAVALEDAVALAVRHSPDDLAIVEPDLRAMHNPSRRSVLAQLARRLALRLRTRCPQCSTPGYGRVGVERGLPCRVCTTTTEVVRAEVDGCAACPYREHRNIRDLADPRWCPFCNP